MILNELKRIIFNDSLFETLFIPEVFCFLDLRKPFSFKLIAFSNSVKHSLGSIKETFFFLHSYSRIWQLFVVLFFCQDSNLNKFNNNMLSSQQDTIEKTDTLLRLSLECHIFTYDQQASRS